MSKNQPFWPTIEATDQNGITAVDMLEIVFFLDPEVCTNPSYVVNAFEFFLNGIGRNRDHFYVDDEGDIQPLPADPREVLNTQLIVPIREKDDVRLFLVDGDRPAYSYYAHYFYDYMELDERPKDEKIPLWFRIPQSVLVDEGPDTIISFALGLAEILPYTYGYVSPGLTCEESFVNALPFIHRYPGLNVANADSVAIDIDDRPLGAYWVNLFGARLNQTLGGLESLQSAFSEPIRVTSCGKKGTCVIIGDVPDIGDTNRQNDLPLYRQLAAFLRPYMQVPRVIYFTDEIGWADREGQAAWHNRFFDD